jgi:hypothetical protein
MQCSVICRSTVQWTLALTAVAAVMQVHLGVASAQITCDGYVNVRTTYMEQPFDQFHRISLYGNLNAGGKIYLDANRYELNLFGDRTTTVGAMTVQNVSFAGIYEVDPAGVGRRVYEVKGLGSSLSMAGKLYLMVYPNESGPHRLVYEPKVAPDMGVRHRMAVTLEPIRIPISHGCWSDWDCR